jgi:phosphate/sulfate permease
VKADPPVLLHDQATTSAVRTAEKTLWAQVHAGVNTQIGFFHVWNRVAADAAQRYVRLKLPGAQRSAFA